ncbi:MAG TPA: carboxypeptidase regulatory-like domain-containing protein [Candidatus Acidoferrum sp.]|nr:carboxypeptidase regulatory-like domain-containing protein [Candidatus Acidoferrum sp.]
MRIRIAFFQQAIAFILVLLLCATAARADVTGSILGVVTDRSQGVVAGAKIVVTNAETNFKQETTSGTDGTFRFLALPVGIYKLTVNAGGFRPFDETGIVLKVNDQLRFDVVLDVGNVNEKVEISANAVQVQTENTQLGDVIESKKMLALPLNGRSYIDLLGLQAGVAPGTAGTIGGDRQVSGNLNAGNISVNGQRETANAFLVNGGDVSEGRNLGAGLVPNLDSIEEFRLITNSFDAEYGKFSGAVVNAITKSGTNSIHGDVFEFLRNDKFDAKNYFFAGKSELRRNQFGYTVGGPVWKNHLFFFSDYQGTREVSGAEASANVPTTQQRQGIFDPCSFGTFGKSCTDGSFVPNTVDGTFWAQLLDQRLGNPAGTTFVGKPYSFPETKDAQGNVTSPACSSTAQCVFPVDPTTGLANIPTAAFSAPVANVLPFIPTPTVGGCPTTNFCNNSQKNSVTDNKYGERIDFNNQKTGNWSWYYHLDNTLVDSALPGFASVPGFPSETPSRAQQFVMSNTKTLGSTAVNEVRASIFRTTLHKDNPAGSFASLSSLGFKTGAGTLGIVPIDGYPQYLPQITFGNLGLNIGEPTLNTFQPNTTYVISDVFSKSTGKHTWKVGGEFRYLQVNERNFASPNGEFTFDGTVTGSDVADFLLGATSNISNNAPYTQAALQLLDSRTKYGGAFGQDSWKVKPNLTLNLGLRWEVSTPWYDTQGKIQTFVPGEQSTVFPLAPTGLVFPGDPGIPKTLAPTRYNNFAPRLGLAYSPGFSDGILGKIFGGPGKTSIRSSYGIYYTSVEDLNLFFEVADAPFGLFWTSPQSVLFDEPFKIRASGQSLGQRFPFTAPIPGAASNQTLGFSVYEPFNFFPGYNIHNRLPYGEHFNLSLQRELSKSTVLTLAYVGTGGHHLITQNESNPGDAALCQQLTAEGAIDVTNGGTAGCGPGQENDVFQVGTPAIPCNTPTQVPLAGCVYSTRHSLLNPNFCAGGAQICFGSGNTNTLTTANSIYHAGEITIERKANDVTFLAAYTFSKAIDDSSAFGDLVNFSNPKLSRGLSSTDVTHNFVASYVWSMPFDRLFKGAPKRLTQGWQMQGITRFSTGFPIQLNQPNEDVSLVGSSATDFPDRVGPVVTVNPRQANPNCQTSDGTGCYFLPGAFALNTTPGTFGTANRRFFHGPGFNNTDFGFLKRTVIREQVAFDLRIEFFNIFNHAQFNNPGGNIDDPGTFGIVTSARAPRIGQISAKFYW